MKDQTGHTLTTEEKLAIVAILENYKFKMSKTLKSKLEERDIIREYLDGSKLTAQGHYLRVQIIGGFNG